MIGLAKVVAPAVVPVVAPYALRAASMARDAVDRMRARRLGVSGVPFFVVNGRVALSGAQPPELFRQAFEKAGDSVGAGEACEVDPATGKRGC